jgi:hypothetical protein
MAKAVASSKNKFNAAQQRAHNTRPSAAAPFAGNPVPRRSHGQGEGIRGRTPAGREKQVDSSADPGVAPSGDAAAVVSDRGAVAAAWRPSSSAQQPPAEEEYFSADEEDVQGDDDDENGERGEGMGGPRQPSYVKNHPILNAAKLAVKTLPKVVGQRRLGRLDIKTWKATRSACRSRRSTRRRSSPRRTSCARALCSPLMTSTGTWRGKYVVRRVAGPYTHSAHSFSFFHHLNHLTTSNSSLS